MSGGEGGVLVGGEPMALLAASSSAYEVAARTREAGLRLAGALNGAASTVAATSPFAPGLAALVLAAVHGLIASPAAGLLTVFAALETVSLQLRAAGQALEAAGAVGLMARGSLGVLRGGRPTVLASTDGVDLRREAATGSWSIGALGGSSSLAVREVRRPDGSTFFVVERTVAGKYAASTGFEVNGAGAFAEAGAGPETTMRWAVATRRDAEMLVALVSGSLMPAGALLLRNQLPKPTETVVAATGTLTATGGAPLPASAASASVAARTEVTFLGTGGQRFSSTISGSGQVSQLGAVQTGGAGSVKVSVDRSPAGAVTRATVTTTTEVDRGRHGNPAFEAGNREATLVEEEWEVDLNPERRAAADRIASALARGRAPDPADVRALGDAARGAVKTSSRTYDVRHQTASVDATVADVGGGGAGSVDTAVLRQP